MEFKLKLPKSELQKITNVEEAMKIGGREGLKKGLYFLEAEAKKGFVGRPVTDAMGTRTTGAGLKVRSGHLRRNIKTRIVNSRNNKVEGSIYNNTVYAAAQEYGVEGRIPARPFISPVVYDKNNILEVERIIKIEIGKARNKLRRGV